MFKVDCLYHSFGMVTAALGLGALLAGCQTYRASPIDLAAHRAAVLARDASLLIPDARLAIGSGMFGGGHGVDPQAFDASDGLSLGEGEALAMFYNPRLKIARMQAGVSLADVVTAGMWQDPEFGFDAADILSSSAATESGFVLSWTLPVSGRLRIEKDRADVMYRAALARAASAEWAVRFEVRRAWIEWSMQTERVMQLEELAERIAGIAQIAHELEEAGELSRIEARLFQVESVESSLQLNNAKAAERMQRLNLLMMLGLSAQSEIRLLPGLPSFDKGSRDGIADLIEGNLDLAVLCAEYDGAEQSLRLAIRVQYPDITIGAGYGTEGDDRLLLGLSVPIPMLNANAPAIERARTEREVARAVIEEAVERFGHDLAESLLEQEYLSQQRVEYQSEVFPLIEAQSEDVRSVVEAGDFDALLVLETVKSFFHAKNALLDLRQRELIAASRVIELVGPERTSEAESGALKGAME